MTAAENDNELITRAVDGDSNAFGDLVQRYEDRLVHSLEHALGSREEAMDAAQQAFVSAWQKLKSFRQDSAFYSWIYRIAMNAAISSGRRKRVSTTSLDKHIAASGNTPEDTSPAIEPDAKLLSEERVQLVREALLQLAEEFRKPLVMKEMDGFSYDKIATILDIPVGTVRSRIFRARREMTERLERLFRTD